jgi:hypothetical protein
LNNTGGGNIKLLANMDNGVINVNGKLDASAPKNGDGGFIETSAAHVNVADRAQISTKANNGKTGTWSIDPVDFTIATSGGDITGTALSNNLANNNVNIASTSGKNGSNGDINVNNSVNWSANQLTLNAQRNININTNLNGSGTAKLALEYGQGALNANNTGKYVVSATVNLPAGQNFSTKSGSDGQVKKYTVITSLGTENDLLVVPAINTLQGIANVNTQVGMPNLNSNYVLGANIDATATSTWNAGAGFTPIGITVPGTRFIDTFGGVFDGRGHSIKNLTINLPNVDGVGLFGNTFGNGAVGQFFPEIRNVGLINANVRGNTMVGGLVGYNQGGLNVSNSFVNGSVTGKSAIGGLVGFNANSAVTNSYADGGVISGNNNIGGLVGNNMGSISNSYATNSVTGTTKVGGLVGDNVLAGMGGALPGTVSNSYWDTIKSGQATSVGGTGLTTVQMKQQANYSGWDFANTWQIKLGVFDPTLQAFNTQTATLVTAVAPVIGDCVAQYSCVRPSINTNPGSTAQSSTLTTSTPSAAGLPSVTEITQATTATTPIAVIIAQPTDITPVTSTTPSAVVGVSSTAEITQTTTTAPATPPVPYAYTQPSILSYAPQAIFTPDGAYKSALYVINTKPSVTEPLVATPCQASESCGEVDPYIVKTEKDKKETFVGNTTEILGMKQSYGYLIDGYSETRFSDGSTKVEFPAYNNRDIFASVEVFDAKGKVVATQYIEAKLLNDNMVGAYTDQAFSYFDDKTGFKDTTISKKSDINVTVPQGGYIKISYASDAAKIANLANQMTTLIFQLFQIRGNNTIALREIKNWSLELAKGLLGDISSAVAIELASGRTPTFDLCFDKLKSTVTTPENVNKLSAALESLGLAGDLKGLEFMGYALNKVKGWSIELAEYTVKGLNVASAFTPLITDQSQFDTTLTPSITRSATGYVTPLQGFDCDVVLNIMSEYKRSERVE